MPRHYPTMLSIITDSGVIGLRLLVLCLWFCIKRVSGYYCEFNLCASADQYCCGDNLCCDYVYHTWYMWVFIVFILLVASACGGFLRFCYYRTDPIFMHTQYVMLQPEESNYPNAPLDVESGGHMVYPFSGGINYSKPSGPPPPYTSAGSHKKFYDKGDKDWITRFFLLCEIFCYCLILYIAVH